MVLYKSVQCSACFRVNAGSNGVRGCLCGIVRGVGRGNVHGIVRESRATAGLLGFWLVCWLAGRSSFCCGCFVHAELWGCGFLVEGDQTGLWVAEGVSTSPQPVCTVNGHSWSNCVHNGRFTFLFFCLFGLVCFYIPLVEFSSHHDIHNSILQNTVSRKSNNLLYTDLSEMNGSYPIQLLYSLCTEQYLGRSTGTSPLCISYKRYLVLMSLQPMANGDGGPDSRKSFRWWVVVDSGLVVVVVLTIDPGPIVIRGY